MQTRANESASLEFSMHPQISTTAHLSAWDFHVLTLNGELEDHPRSAWHQLPDPIEPDDIDHPTDADIEDAFLAAIAGEAS